MGNLTVVQKGERDLISDGDKGKWNLLLLAMWFFCLLSDIVQWLDCIVTGWLFPWWSKGREGCLKTVKYQPFDALCKLIF